MWEELRLGGGGEEQPVLLTAENAHKPKRAFITDQVQEVKVSQRLN